LFQLAWQEHCIIHYLLEQLLNLLLNAQKL